MSFVVEGEQGILKFKCEEGHSDTTPLVELINRLDNVII